MRGMIEARRRLAELLLSECGDVPRKNALALGAIVSGSALGALLIQPNPAHADPACHAENPDCIAFGFELNCGAKLCCSWPGPQIVCCVDTFGGCPTNPPIDDPNSVCCGGALPDP